PEFGELQAFSTSIVELNHQPLNLAYNKSNKVDATEQTLRYAGQKDAMNVHVANYTHLLQTSTADEEVIKDAKFWLDIFASKKARLAAARLNQERMQPSKQLEVEAKLRKRKMKEDQEALIQELQKKFGGDNSEDGSEVESSADEKGSTIPYSQKDLLPGHLLKGRILQVQVRGLGKGSQRLISVGDIEQHLQVDGLVVALLDLMKKEKLVKGLSADDIRQSEASPFMTLRIRRPVFQSETDLENHI